jgi:uncharacterized membrane protein
MLLQGKTEYHQDPKEKYMFPFQTPERIDEHPPFLLAIVLSVSFQITDFSYHYGIFKYFLHLLLIFITYIRRHEQFQEIIPWPIVL